MREHFSELLFLAHPQCSCTQASLDELAEILARAKSQPKTYVLFLKPSSVGDSWEQTDVPLAEEIEEYEVTIGARTVTVAAPSFLYTAAEIAADGGLATPFRFSVAQLSLIYGRGTAAEAEIWFTS